MVVQLPEGVSVLQHGVSQWRAHSVTYLSLDGEAAGSVL